MRLTELRSANLYRRNTQWDESELVIMIKFLIKINKSAAAD